MRKENNSTTTVNGSIASSGSNHVPYMNGCKYGTFRTNAEITRAEGVRLTNAVLGITERT